MASEVTVQVRVLGPVDVVDGEGQNVSLRGPIQARLLAVLVAAAPSSVSVDDLVVILWPDGGLPDDPIGSVRTYVARLRRALGPESVVTATGSYRLGEVETDLRRFEGLIERARRASGSPTVADLWRQALDLWRGPAFGDVADVDLVTPVARRLEELRAEATEAWFDARLAAGEGRELAADVDRAVAEFPLREGFRVQQMTVLFRAGRQGEALRAFQEFRADLTEIGLEPSARLVELDAEIAAGRTPRSGARRTLRGYELGDRIGEGAFAVVYQATQASVGRDVAIKQIRGSLADQPAFIAQFEAEAHLVARLEHPHIVPLYDYWREPGSAFLVMRYLDGGSLAGRLIDGPLALGEVVGLTQQVAAGLDAAHRAGVIHRDVKPANILLDQVGNAYLSDFGIAVEETERIDPEAWLSNGSPAYAPPEQLRREPVGPPADVYALGVTIYEALTGRLPFPGETTMAGLLRRQLEDPIPLVRLSRPEVPAAIDTVIHRATAKNPDERYGSASELARDLARAAGLEGDAELIGVVDRNPYKGLRAFEEADAADFSGRDRLVSQLVSAVGEQRVVAVVGPSGSGKSSVVRAGLLPAIRAGRWPGSERWFVTTMTPGAEPFADLTAALLRVAVDPPPDLESRLTGEVSGLAWTVRRLVPEDRELVVVIDQFEELFTVGAAPTRRRFLDALVAAVGDEQTRLRLVLTLRADFYDRPLRHPAFAQLIRSATVPVHPLAADELERVITEPAASVGARFEPGLVAAIAADVADEPGALPLLQYALTELFEARDGQVMTRAAYDRLGGVPGALARRAEEEHSRLAQGEQEAAQRIFGRLVSLGEGTEDTRRRVARAELGTGPETEAVLNVFGGARLLSFDRDTATREPTVEVAHEALIREWPRLRAWLDEDRDGLRILRHLTESAAAWEGAGRPASELYRGGRLEAAEMWAIENRARLTAVEVAFLDAGLGARAAELAAEADRLETERRSNRRLRRLLAGVAVALALALVASVLAFQQRGAARESAAEAETRRMIADAASIIDENVDIGLLLAAEGYRRDPSAAGLAGLQRVLTSTGSYLGRLGAGFPMHGVIWDEDEIIGVSGDQLLLFDGTTLEPIGQVRLPAAVRLGADESAVVAHRPDVVAVAMEGGGLAIVDLPQRSVRMIDHSYEVTALAFDAAGTRIAVGDMAKTVSVASFADLSADQPLSAALVWAQPDAFPESNYLDVPGFEESGEYASFMAGQVVTSGWFESGVLGLGFLGTGDVVATSSGMVRSFDSGTGAIRHEVAPGMSTGGKPGGFPNPVWKLAIADDQVLAIAPTRANLLDASLNDLVMQRFDPGRLDANVTARGDAVLDGSGGFMLAMSDGRVIAGRIDGQTSATLINTVAIDSAALAVDPSGTVGLLATPDGVLLTALRGRQLLATAVPREGRLVGVPSPDGTRVTVSTPGSELPPLVYALDQLPPRLLELPLDDPPLDDVAYLTDNLLLSDIGPSRRGALRRADDFSELLKLPKAEFGAAVSPDERIFVLGRGTAVVGVASQEVLVYDLPSGVLRATLQLGGFLSKDDRVRQMKFSPDGTRLLATTMTGWVVEIDPVEPRVLSVHEADPEAGEAMTAIAFSPDGGSIASRGVGGEIAIRDAVSFDKLFTLEGGTSDSENFTNGPFSSSDGRYLLTTREQRPRLWDLESRTSVGAFPSDQGMPSDGAIGSDSLQLATIVGDYALVWNLNTDEWFDITCQAAGRNFTPEEWEQYGPAGEPYRATCSQWPALG